MSFADTDTIAAIATAHGVGAISIVRVSGSKALELAKEITKKPALNPRKATLCNLFDTQGELMDKAIVIYFKAPKSFTGEDIVEFQCHGGVVIAQTVLETLCSLGARVALPGEFTKRAFINGKIDLSQAEAIAKLIEAKSKEAVKLLARQLQGELKEFVEEVREKLIRILAYVEVNIDYAEEDLPPDLMEQIKLQLEELQKELKKVVESSKRRAGLIEGFKIAIIGKPNTGKSSLLNSLLNYERAIVSDIAGTTRDTIEEQVKIGTHLVKVVDTAGIREASDKIEKIGVERSLKAIQESDIVVVMFDASRDCDEEDRKILELVEEYREKKQFIFVFNKIDLGVSPNRCKVEGEVVELSVMEGIEPLVKKLQQLLDNIASEDEVLLISQRQIQAVTQALKEIESSKTPLELGELEIFAFHLNEALRNIASITRPMEHTELLDKMFGEFCLGK